MKEMFPIKFCRLSLSIVVVLFTGCVSIVDGSV